MAVLAEDAFTSYTLGAAPPSPWIVSGTVTVELDPAVGGAQGRVLKFNDQSGSEHAAKLPFSAANPKVVCTVKVYPGQTDKSFYLSLFVGGTRHDILRFSATGAIQYLNSSSVWTALPTATSYSSNTWVTVQFTIDRTATSAEIVSVKVGGVTKGTALNRPDFAGNIDAIECHTDATETGVIVHIDDIQVLEKERTVKGLVRSTTGAAVVGATVVLIDHATNTIITTGVTGGDGTFSIVTDAGPTIAVIAYKAGASLGGSCRPEVLIF